MTATAGRSNAGRPGEPGGSAGQMLLDRRFTPLTRAFFNLYRRPQQGGGALAVYLHGEPVVDVWAGWAARDRRWTSDSVSLSFSTGKGLASTVVHRLAERGLIDYDARVADYWPEFAAAGKEAITVRELLTHRAGLQRVRGLLPNARDLLDHDKLVHALEQSPPDPRRLRRPGYHAITYGALVVELTQRVTGTEFTELVRTEVADVIGAEELWYRVPHDQRHRIARTFPNLKVPGLRWEQTSSLMTRLHVLGGLAEAGMPEGFDQLVHDPAIHDAVMPGWNGVFSARALAKMYGALANRGTVDGARLLEPETVQQIGRVQTRARDYVLGLPMNWRLGYHRGFTSGRVQPRMAFGHYGLGGSGGFADPETGLSLGYVTNRLGSVITPLGDARLARLAAAAIAAGKRLR